MTLTERFLKAKHWQLFIPVIGIPILGQIIMIATMFTNFEDGSRDPSDFFTVLAIFQVGMVIVCGIVFTWFWSIAMGLQTRIPAALRMNTAKFKIFFFSPIAYLSVFMLLMSSAFGSIGAAGQNGVTPNIGLIGSFMMIIVPLHLFSMFCILYCIYFVAKAFKTAEMQRETSFSDFAGDFFLIWFYPIGIWIIQPKVNRIAKSVQPSESI
jgi:hypothetical protein